MRRKVYASFLALFTIAASIPANAWEWREISKTDFGGNDTNDHPICRIQQTDLNTDLIQYNWETNYVAGSYMIIKATHLADCGRGTNLTNWGDHLPGAPKWAKGGDHTYPDDPNKGYFMAFDLPFLEESKLYEKTLPISCQNVEFKLEAYFATLDYTNQAKNWVEASIESNGVSLQNAKLDDTNEEWSTLSDTIKWVPLSTSFFVDDPSIKSIDFVLRAKECSSAGYDIAMDDITISVKQPSISYEGEKYQFQKPATIKVAYDQSEFDEFYPSDSEVKYQWYKYDKSSYEFVEIKEAGGAYTSGKDLSLTIPSFDKNVDNGTYRLVVAPTDAFEADGLNPKAIQKDIVIDQEINEVDGGEIHMDTLICKDQILFGKEYTTEGEYTVVRPGATESGCTLDTVWRIKVMDVSLKIRAFNDNYEICEGQSVSLLVTLRAFDSEGKGLHTEYHWEPEVPDNSLNPTLYLDQTTEYTFYADFNLPSDADKNAKGCHVKESFTINVHKSPKLTIDSIDSQNGNVEVSIKEGTAPYLISVDFNPISSTDDNLVLIEKLNNGDHVLQVIDNVGCSSEEVIEIKGTAVDDILADPSSNDNNYYNVNGQKVASPEKGKVYINNGKKIMYK